MKKPIQSLWLLSALALFLSVGISLSAQQTTPPSQSTDQQADPATAPPTQDQAQPSQTPSQPPDQANHPSPDAQAPSAQPTSGQSFTGTIVKANDKYVLQEEASGKTYDIDHQNEVQKFEGKRVKVHGTLDESGKTIHLQ